MDTWQVYQSYLGIFAAFLFLFGKIPPVKSHNLRLSFWFGTKTRVMDFLPYVSPTKKHRKSLEVTKNQRILWTWISWNAYKNDFDGIIFPSFWRKSGGHTDGWWWQIMPWSFFEKCLCQVFVFLKSAQHGTYLLFSLMETSPLNLSEKIIPWLPLHWAGNRVHHRSSNL